MYRWSGDHNVFGNLEDAYSHYYANKVDGPLLVGHWEEACECCQPGTFSGVEGTLLGIDGTIERCDLCSICLTDKEAEEAVMEARFQLASGHPPGPE